MFDHMGKEVLADAILPLLPFPVIKDVARFI
jgi:hypothetical protein